MNPEKSQFQDPEKPRQQFEQLDAELSAAKERQLQEHAEYLKEIERFLVWIGEMMGAHRVGKDPGRSLSLNSTIEDLRIAAEREEELAKRRGATGIPHMNKFSAMISKLKDATFIPPEARTIEELYDTLRGQLEDGKKNLELLKNAKD